MSAAAAADSAGVIRAYLDTCIVSGLAPRNRPVLEPNERKAMLKLLQLHDEGAVQLITSVVALEEIERESDDEETTPHVAIRLLLRNVRTVSIANLAPLGPVGAKPRSQYPTRSRIKVVLPDLVDVEHLYQTWVHRLHYFVTVDRSTILDLRDQLAAGTGISAVKPSELLGIVRGTA